MNQQQLINVMYNFFLLFISCVPVCLCERRELQEFNLLS